MAYPRSRDPGDDPARGSAGAGTTGLIVEARQDNAASEGLDLVRCQVCTMRQTEDDMTNEIRRFQ
jgi:hypothetical protein